MLPLPPGGTVAPLSGSPEIVTVLGAWRLPGDALLTRIAALVLLGLVGSPARANALTPRGSTVVRQEADKKVWVNPTSSVYHCPGTRYWGKTKSGLLMFEDDAVAAGHRPAYGRPCGLVRPVPKVDTLVPVPRALTAPPPDDAVQVWVNTSSGVFHCPGTRYYGATKAGRYLKQAAARSAGYRPANGTSCRAGAP